MHDVRMLSEVTKQLKTYSELYSNYTLYKQNWVLRVILKYKNGILGICLK